MPVEVYAPCGFGKTEVLRSIAESEVGPDGRRLAIPRIYFEVGAKKSGDVLHMLVDRLYATDAPVPVKLSRSQCARLVSGSRALLLLDDVPADSSLVHSSTNCPAAGWCSPGNGRFWATVRCGCRWPDSPRKRP
jgi:hypothetical protein